MDQTHHVIDYVELSVADLPASKDFYERAFGWRSPTGPYAFPGGRRFLFRDNSGNVLGVWATS